nr:hypothetical protein [uncultured bacterium]
MLHSLAWFQGRDKKVFRTFYFALLNGRSRIDVFRADFGAIAHESTAPYAVLAVQLRHTLLLTVVAAIFVITMRQRNGSRTDELWVQAKLRARGVRGLYDRYGFPVAKLIRSRWVADLVWVLMKPAEWIFLAVIYLTDRHPEDRIAVQYTA